MNKFNLSPKVIFIHHGAVPGGAPTSLRNLVSSLSDKNQFQITICCPFSKMIPFFQKNKNIRVISYPRPCKISGKVAIGWASIYNLKTMIYFIVDIFYSPISIIREFLFLKSLNPDIVHLNSSILWTSAIAAKLNRYPLVWHIRENFIGGPKNIRRRIYAFFLRKLADKVVCISPSEEISIDGENDEKCHVVYNSINLSQFQKELYDSTDERKKLGIKKDKFVVLSLGGTSFRKGTFQIIESLNFLDQSCKILIAGESAISINKQFKLIIKGLHSVENFLIKSKIKQYYSWFYDDRLANSLDKIDNSKVTFTGVVDDLPELINACDVLVFAGTTPHFSRPIFEAWAMEKPIVVFDTAVMQREVNNGKDGLIVKKHTGLDLSRALNHLRRNPVECYNLGQNGWKNSQEKFDFNRNAAKIVDIYNVLFKFK